MKFLFEVSDREYQLNDDYGNLDNAEKVEFLQNEFKSLGLGENSIYLINQIVRDGDNYLANDLYKIAQMIPCQIGEQTAKTIAGLGAKSNKFAKDLLTGGYVSSRTLYNDEDANVAYKIKVLTVALENGNDISRFKNAQGWKAVSKFQSALPELLNKFNSKNSEQISIADALRKNKLINTQDYASYVFNLLNSQDNYKQLAVAASNLCSENAEYAHAFKKMILNYMQSTVSTDTLKNMNDFKEDHFYSIVELVRNWVDKINKANQPAKSSNSKPLVADVVKQILNVDELTPSVVYSYIEDIANANENIDVGMKKLLLDNIHNGTFNNEIEDVLKTSADKVQSHMGQDSNTLVANLFLTNLLKALRG